MFLWKKFLVLIAALLTFNSLHAQTTISSNNYLIGASGSYRVTANVSFIRVNTSNVVIDLNGFTVSGSTPATCSVTVGTTGNSCTSGTVVGQAAFAITGRNVTIKNGIISGGTYHGIESTVTGRSDIHLEDLTIQNFQGACVKIASDNLWVRNVHISQCGSDGIQGNNASEVTIVDSTSDYNNGNGVSVLGGSAEGLQVNYNGGSGISASLGSFVGTRITAKQNNVYGIYANGIIGDSFAGQNGSDGIQLANGVVHDVASSSNVSDGVRLNSNSCYAHVSAAGNAVNVSGGVAMTGSVTTCP